MVMSIFFKTVGPVMANHLCCYDTVLFLSTGYVKNLLEFLSQHNSSTKLNKILFFHVVSYSSLLDDK